MLASSDPWVLSMDGETVLLWYDLQKNSVKQVEIHGLPRRFMPLFVWGAFAFLRVIMYLLGGSTKSLVPLRDESFKK